MNEQITISAEVNAPVSKVWEYYNTPEHVMNWNTPDQSWHSPSAQNDLSVGGKFNYRMEAKDGSAGFDFEGVYTDIKESEIVEYKLTDGRMARVEFKDNGDTTSVTIHFDPESENEPEFQKQGWQAILDSFKHYTESN